MGQAVSYGLNQAEVDELVEQTGGACEPSPLPPLPPPPPPRRRLTAPLSRARAVTQEEVEALYKRFRSLDRGRKGFVTADEFLSIPELSINPLAKRLALLHDGINFREFVDALAPYSRAAPRAAKLRHLFAVWDADGDGALSAEDVELTLRQLGGSALGDGEVRALVARVFEAAGAAGKMDVGLTFKQFERALEGAPVKLSVDVPAGDD